MAAVFGCVCSFRKFVKRQMAHGLKRQKVSLQQMLRIIFIKLHEVLPLVCWWLGGLQTKKKDNLKSTNALSLILR